MLGAAAGERSRHRTDYLQRCGGGNAFSKSRDFAGRLDDRFQDSNHRGPLENAAVLRTEANTPIDRFHGFARLGLVPKQPGTAISVRYAVRSPAPTESKT
jgi:hypothetical protein